jgi:hypothetical protein
MYRQLISDSVRFALTVILAAFIVCGVSRGADAPESSRVLRVTLLRFVDGRFDLDLMLYHRVGRFHHGYAPSH